MKNKIEYIFFLLFSLFFSLLGQRLAYRTAGLFTVLVFYLIPIRKKIVLENLSFAFPDYSYRDIKKLSFGCYKSFIITLMEILTMNSLNEDQVREKVKVENKELIPARYCDGKGVILLSAHMGNWEYLAASVALQLNLPFNIIVKSQRNPYVDKWMNAARTRWINNVVPLGISIRTIYKQLKGKNIVAMAADQRGPAEGIKMPFFGRKTSVYTGPAILALKTGAPIIFGISVRQPDFSYKTSLHEIRTDDLPGEEEEKILEITRRQTEYLEQIIRKYPEQWLWMHNRWKH